MSQRVTYVAAYSDTTTAPGVTPHMECMGGKLLAVQFNDALEELTNLREAVQALSMPRWTTTNATTRIACGAR